MSNFHGATHQYRVAEADWQDELERLFGNRAGDVRYTNVAHGQPGSKLAKLYAAYVEARDKWYEARAIHMREH